ncbi:uncharacterized protein FSUBG_3937 [Fusarium subglutinans]|uniref:2EXR domain-containing protein n=1 Tax=Gibberella subglutinans TaxID=42677 RepID=A0A8H5Q7D1_GIBSU|nr:uncharacterized protein FSUBG_3937 [Fusarium subglutinans]KAF5609463.1 hypothetical protein FSUBG_3937 [Fusarium subglutinans]
MFQLVKKLFKNEPQPKGAFHRFGELPQEIQNLIWAYALCVDAPRAYFVDVKGFPMWPRELRIAHSIPTNLGNFPHPPSSNPGGDYDLMRVCRASYQEITRCWTLYRPQVPVRMRLDNSHDNATRVKEESGLHIDAASYLVIVERWCHGNTRVSGFRAVLSFAPPVPYRGLEAIRRVAVPFDSEFDYYQDSALLSTLEAVFPGIHTLYFYVKPAHFDPLERRHQGIPVDFLIAKPWPGKGPPERFRARGRIFYELCPEEMKRVGINTHRLVIPWSVERWRWRQRPKGIACIKFITWQWIQ